MSAIVKHLLFLQIVILVICFVKSIPTSVLADTKDVAATGSNGGGGPDKKQSDKKFILGSDHAPLTAEPPVKLAPKKRGVNSQYLDHELTKDIQSNDYILPNNEPVYLDKAEDLYYSSRPRFNEPWALPVLPQQNAGYYDGDRRKRSNLKSYDYRLKRESKLSPEYILDLLAAIEKSNRPYLLTDNNENRYFTKQHDSSNLALPSIAAYGIDDRDNDGPIDDNGEWWNSVVNEPNYQYYPYSINNNNNIESKYGGDRYQKLFPSKRYMVAKKKRSLTSRDWYYDGSVGGAGVGSVGAGPQQYDPTVLMQIAPGFDTRLSNSPLSDQSMKNKFSYY